MPSGHTYRLVWVSLTLDMGYLFMAAPAKLLLQRSYPTSEVRGGSQEEQPHIQGVVAAQAQEGLEELFHIQGQERGW